MNCKECGKPITDVKRTRTYCDKCIRARAYNNFKQKYKNNKSFREKKQKTFREYVRNRYANDPVYREKKKEQNRINSQKWRDREKLKVKMNNALVFEEFVKGK